MSPRSSSSAAAVIPGPPSSGTRKRQKASQHDEPLPAVDERLVMPGARAEIINGKVYFVPPADEPHGSTHATLSSILCAHVTHDYSVALDMLTRTSKKDDFAPDASVYPSERDPKTGGRKLEEIAVEIASKQSLTMPTRKARELIKRGVRRVFCVVLKKRHVLEWSRDADAFQPLPDDHRIEDRCFVRPLPVRALLDGAESDRAIVEALRAREDATLMSMLDGARDEGIEKGIEQGIEQGIEKGIEIGHLRARRETLYLLLRAKGHAIDDASRARIDACTDTAMLDRWILAAIESDPATSSIGDPP